MGRRKLHIWVAFLIVIISAEATFIWAQGTGNGNGNNGNGNGNRNIGNGNGNGNNGNSNGNGNIGNGNGSGNNGDNNGNGNYGSGNGNGNNGNGNGSGNGNSGNDNNGNGYGDSNGNGNGNNVNGNGNGNNGNGNENGNNGNGNGNGNGNSGNANNGNGYGGSNGNGNGNNGNGNGNGNTGNGNGNGNNGTGNGNGNNGNGNGNDNNGNGNGNGNGSNYNSTTDYIVLTPLGSGQERALCQAAGTCSYKILTCPSQCPQKKPRKNKKNKGCFIDCSSKCEATCKYRKPNCNGYGSLCYDPRFVGGDGVMFYFHGAKGENFAIVSDDHFQINARFIGNRPQGSTRDFTWVQALSIMFETHTLVVAAKRVSHWDDNVDALVVRWDGELVNIPTDGDAEWRTNFEEREVLVEKTENANSVRVKVAGIVDIYIKVRPIGEKENKVHNYRLPADDAFAHLETQFKFSNLSDLVEGVLGKTYRPDYVSSVKIGVPMPMMGGEDKYHTPSLLSPLCKACRFQRPSMLALDGVAQY